MGNSRTKNRRARNTNTSVGNGGREKYKRIALEGGSRRLTYKSATPVEFRGVTAGNMAEMNYNIAQLGIYSDC